MTPAVSPPNGPILIGRVGRAHGLRGGFYVAEREDAIPKDYGELWIGPSLPKARRAKILSATLPNGRPLLLTDLASDRTAAEGLTGELIWVERERVVDEEEDELAMLWDDLADARVVDSHGEPLGVVIEIYNAGSSDIVVVKAESGAMLDLPVVETYVDFERGVEETEDGNVLRLVVEKSVFDELWQKPS